MIVNGFFKNMPACRSRILVCCIVAVLVSLLALYSAGCSASNADSADKETSETSPAAVSEEQAEQDISFSEPAIDVPVEAAPEYDLTIDASGGGSKQLFVTNALEQDITALTVRHIGVKKFGGGLAATDLAWHDGDVALLTYDIPAPFGDDAATTTGAVTAPSDAAATTGAVTAPSDDTAATGTATAPSDDSAATGAAVAGGQDDLYDIRLKLSDGSKLILHAVDFDASKEITVKRTDDVAFIIFAGSDGKEISTYEAEKAVQIAEAEAKAKKAEAKEAEAKAKAEAEKKKAESYKPPSKEKKHAGDECVDDIVLR